MSLFFSPIERLCLSCFFVCLDNPSLIIPTKLSDRPKKLFYLDDPTAPNTRNCCFLMRLVCGRGSKLWRYKWEKNHVREKNKNPKRPLVTSYTRKYHLLSPDIHAYQGVSKKCRFNSLQRGSCGTYLKHHLLTRKKKDQTSINNS